MHHTVCWLSLSSQNSMLRLESISLVFWAGLKGLYRKPPLRSSAQTRCSNTISCHSLSDGSSRCKVLEHSKSISTRADSAVIVQAEKEGKRAAWTQWCVTWSAAITGIKPRQCTGRVRGSHGYSLSKTGQEFCNPVAFHDPRSALICQIGGLTFKLSFAPLTWSRAHLDSTEDQ